MLWCGRQLPRRHVIDQFTTLGAQAFSSNPLHYYCNYTNLLEACIRSKSVAQAKIIHQLVIKDNTQIEDRSLLLEKLARLYLTCNQVEVARRVFDEIPQPNPNVIIWNLLIRAYAWNGPFERAIELYYGMLELGVKPSKYTYPFVLKACSGLQALHVGQDIHQHAKRLGLGSDVYVCTALIDLYAKCGDLVAAQSVFDGMLYKDVVAWNAMIAGFSLHGLCGDTAELLVQMQRAGTAPNASTIVAVLPTVAQANALSQGKAMHGYSMRRRFSDDVVLSTALLDMYAKCQCIVYARRIFDAMSVRNEVCWSAMIGGCDSMREAMSLFDEMVVKDVRKLTRVTLGSILRACTKLTDLSRGRRVHCYAIKAGFDLNTMVGNTILSMYAKCGIIDDAFRLFDIMDPKDTVSYGAIISGCVQNGYAKEALLIFHQMQLSGIDPDLATMAGVLPACSHLAALQHGACGHGYSIAHGFATDTSICNALIDMYSKCGKIHIGRQVFDRMLKRDTVSWNTMIVGYGIHGLGMEAISQFHNMQAAGIKPDDVTFIGLLSACSHSGLVTEGKHWFSAMSQDFSITPRMEHYICMVDLLARTGLLAEAHSFIQSMPFEADVRVWSALLAACRVHNNIELGEEVSRKVQGLGSEGTGNLVLLSNMYSSIGRWDDAAHVRIKQKDQGLKKSPGCSWVEINGVIHGFLGGDQSHPESAQIHEKLEELLVDMKRMGYCAENSFVLQDVEEEEKERILLYHSEKLAIAYGALHLSPGKPIFVTKNLRVCGDCHAAIKSISLVTKREITVRDVSRFHHFSDGNCSCADFW
ncbi:pentatricopeptide repeat-containing protein At3g16610 [Rosa rugosa]|uniref:pentatricopeptide repeat-containing protein At3g16610 n=1 Tax=Rosa rugosa TaxID=74645 RepID=UPI002B411CB5|nr:pentatricopeptide repeat-containing protein At3g16610 [Rosa rugosa]XP_062029504.1 pentatricopeptide repeat-containing protein At3g16610 [Rosa rugosa]